MAKYSDVLGDGERDPKNFYSQLMRCSSIEAINALATINNRWILQVAGEQLQVLLEAEFLNDSIREKLERFRKTHAGAVAFTRAGTLLNLKLILASSPDQPFRKTAAGASSLHANDYVESSKPIATVGTMPVLAEFAPVWELQNRREFRQLLIRSYHLYRLLLADAGLQAFFRSHTDHDIADLDFGCLSYRKYFAVLFAIYTVVHNGVQQQHTSIFDLTDIATKAGLTTDELTAFVDRKSLTRSAARGKLGAISDAGEFVQKVESSPWCSDQRLFRNRPLLELDDGRFIALDLQFVFEGASAGIAWSMAQHLPSEKRTQFLGHWGELFERLSLELLTHYFPATMANRSFVGGEIDGVLQVGTDAIIFEFKAGFIPDPDKGSRDAAKFEAALRSKFVRDGDGSAKGVTQLASAAQALVAGHVTDINVTGRVFPILVGEDPVLQTIATNTALNDIFLQDVQVGAQIAPVTVMLIDELQTVLPYLAAGDVSWQELLAARFIGDRVSAQPVNAVFDDMARQRKFPLRKETFLAQEGEDLIEILEQTFGHLK